MNQQLSAPQLLDGEDEARDRAVISESNSGHRVEISQQAALVNGNGDRSGESRFFGGGEFHGCILPVSLFLQKPGFVAEVRLEKGIGLCYTLAGRYAQARPGLKDICRFHS